MTKKLFERWAAQHGVSIRKYHGDNSIVASAEFMSHFKLKDQTFDFSGTEAHHQNGVAKRSIILLCNGHVQWYCMQQFIVQNIQILLELWPFASQNQRSLPLLLPFYLVACMTLSVVGILELDTQHALCWCSNSFLSTLST